MDIPLPGLVAIPAYLAAASWIARSERGPTPSTLTPKQQGLMLGFVAVIAHAIALYPSTVTSNGLNVGIFNAGSLVSWCIAALVLVATIKRPLESLAVVILPVAAFAVALDLWFPSVRILRPGLQFGLELHIALSIVAYSLFAIATIQAIYLAIADRKLRQHHPIMSFLPPLTTMETVLFQLTTIAFFLLSASLVLGAFYIHDIRGQHLAHKIVFSLLAWLIFAVLTIGRWRFGWRRRLAVRMVVTGFGLLALAFFGTKAVLELILHKV